MSMVPICPGVTYAPPTARDAFLNALDGDDRALSVSLARDLVACANPLPGLTRDALGLPSGATYGTAARYILALGNASAHVA